MTNKNILLITIDALRTDRLSCLGYKRKTTPYIDKLCQEEGVLFSQAISQSSHTPESFPALFTSTYPFIHDSEKFTIAELLKQKGYITAAFHSNPFLSRAYNYDRGFDDFDDNLLLGINKPLTFLHRVVNYFRVEPYLTAQEINERAISWLQRKRTEKNFFLWLHYMDSHGPYQPPLKYQKEFLDKVVDKKSAKRLWRRTVDAPESITESERQTLINLYDAEVKYVDEYIGKLVEELKELNMFDKTLVVITSDHGEQFQEHGEFNHPRQLYDELIRVPLIFIDSSLPKGKIISEQVRSIDIVPTIFDILGLKISPDFEGESLLQLIKGEDEELKLANRQADCFTPTQSHFFKRSAEKITNDIVGLEAISECSGKHREKGTRKFSIRTEDYKYILVISPDGEKNREFYFIRRDLEEKNNLVNGTNRIAKKILKRLDVKLQEHIARINSHTKPLPEREMNQEELREVKERLKVLGYLDR